MKPKKEDLLLFMTDRKNAAKHFLVSERTIVRWLQSYDLYYPKKNYGCNKINDIQAEEIRKKYKSGYSVLFLTKEYNVTASSIGRIIHNITHKKNKPFAEVYVVYNPC